MTATSGKRAERGACIHCGSERAKKWICCWLPTSRLYMHYLLLPALQLLHAEFLQFLQACSFHALERQRMKWTHWTGMSITHCAVISGCISTIMSPTCDSHMLECALLQQRHLDNCYLGKGWSVRLQTSSGSWLWQSYWGGRSSCAKQQQADIFSIVSWTCMLDRWTCSSQTRNTLNKSNPLGSRSSSKLSLEDHILSDCTFKILA